MIPLGRELQRLALVAVRPTASSHVVARVDAAVMLGKCRLRAKDESSPQSSREQKKE